MLITDIKIKGEEVDVDIHLRGSVVVIRGDNPTEKSLFIDIMKIEEAQMIASRVENKIEIFDKARANINEIKTYRDKLIIIDNADESIVDFINNDCNNQYIIMGGSISKLHIMPNYIGHLEIRENDGKKVMTLEYDYTKPSWW